MAADIEITVLSGPSTGDIFRFTVENAKEITIGRSPDNDLVLQDPTVSRKHAVIGFHDKQVRLMDLGSTHGTVHMGFPVSAGADGARPLSNGDEFKVGDALFKVNFDEEIAQPVTEAPSEAAQDSAASVAPKKSKKKLLLLAGVAVIAVVALMLFPGKKKAPKQLSHIAMSLPQERVIGDLRDGRKKTEKDTRHKQMAQFKLPPSNLLIEFDVKTSANIDVYVDEGLVTTIEPQTDFWRPWQIVIRDPQVGAERKIIFKNTGYKKSGKSKKWGIRDIRATPLTRQENSSFDEQLQNVEALAVTLDQTPSSLAELIRELQVAVLESSFELARTGVSIPVSLESAFMTAPELEQEISGILTERRTPLGEDSLDSGTRHLRVLSDLTARLDAELWRRVNNRINRAKLAADAKNWIVAHDSLVATMKMFPDESDSRWITANRMYGNKKIVPKKVRQNPSKYRR